MQQKTYKPGHFFLFGFFIIAAIVLADQYTKWLVMETMLRIGGDMQSFQDWFMTHRPVAYFFDQREDYNTVQLAPFLNFVMVWNQGISFGMFDDGEGGFPVVLIGVALLISLLMIIWLALASRRTIALGISMIVGGAVGNVLDRVRFGAVADFVDMHVAGYHWPAFNLADSCIVLGALLLIVDTAVKKEKSILSVW